MVGLFTSILNGAVHNGFFFFFTSVNRIKAFPHGHTTRLFYWVIFDVDDWNGSSLWEFPREFLLLLRIRGRIWCPWGGTPHPVFLARATGVRSTLPVLLTTTSHTPQSRTSGKIWMCFLGRWGNREVCLLVRNCAELRCKRGLGFLLCSSQHGREEELCYWGFRIRNHGIGYVALDDSFLGLEIHLLLYSTELKFSIVAKALNVHIPYT